MREEILFLSPLPTEKDQSVQPPTRVSLHRGRTFIIFLLIFYQIPSAKSRKLCKFFGVKKPEGY